MKRYTVFCFFIIFNLLYIVISLSTLALAQTVYVTCTTYNKATGNRIGEFTVTIDESTRKITHKYEDGSTFNTEGFFSVNTISYKFRRFPQVSSGEFWQYEINRVNLDVEVTIRNPNLPTMSSSGSCEIIDVPDRKI